MSKAWIAPPRYLFRKFNVERQLAKYTDIKSFVDVGCGAGEMATDIVHRFGYSGSGVDFSESAIRLAKKVRQTKGLGQNPKFVHGDISTIARMKPVDLVTCFEVLEHVEDDSKLMKDLVNLSKKYILVSVPAKQKLFSHSDVLAGHFRRYDKADLLKLLDEHDLEVVNIISYGYPFTNLFRLLRELLSKVKARENKSSKTELSKKSGVNLFERDKHPSVPGYHALIRPALWFSLLFNEFDVAEGYLAVCLKRFSS